MRKSPYPVSLLLLIVFLLLGTTVQAQLRHHNLSRKSKSFSTNNTALSSDAMDLPMADRMGSQRWHGNEWVKEYSKLQDRQSSIEKTDMGKDRMSYPELQYPVRENKRAKIDGQKARESTFGKRFEAGLVPKYRDAWSVNLEENLTKYNKNLDDISMQDLNRFVFRKNHSSNPGIPTQQVGVGE